MTLTIEKNTLLDALGIVGKAVNAKSTMSILECVQLTSTGMEVIIEATNMEYSARTSIPCISERGAICISAKQLTDILKKMPDGDIILSTAENHLVKLSSGKKIKFDIQGQDATIFPTIVEPDGDNTCTIEASALKDAVTGVVFCASRGDTNRMMSGVQLIIENDTARFCALDGHRIGIRTVKLTAPVSERKEVIIPANYLSEIVKVLPSEDIEITISQKDIKFSCANSIFTTRLIEGNYFKIEQMINLEPKIVVTAKRDDLYNSIDRANLILANFKKPVILNISETGITVKGVSQVGNIEEQVEISQKTGDSLKIGFNPTYMADLLRAVSDEDVCIDLINAKSAAIIKGMDYTYLILPVNFVEVAA